MPAAARINDFQQCAMQTPGVPPIPHIGGPIISGQANVLIGKIPAATVGSQCLCNVGLPNYIVSGSPTVLINGKPAARQNDKTAHGGTIVSGCVNVIIG